MKPLFFDIGFYYGSTCGISPVLARHYTDFGPERLKRIYDGAGLRVLGLHDLITRAREKEYR